MQAALGALGAWIGCRRRGIPLPAYADAIAPGIALAQAIARVAKNPDLVARMVDESQVVLQQYGVFDQQMYRMERYYYSLAGQRTSSRTRLARSFDRLFLWLMVQLT